MPIGIYVFNDWINSEWSWFTSLIGLSFDRTGPADCNLQYDIKPNLPQTYQGLSIYKWYIATV